MRQQTTDSGGARTGVQVHNFRRMLIYERALEIEIDACLEVGVRLGLLSIAAPQATARRVNELAAMISGFKLRLCGRVR